MYSAKEMGRNNYQFYASEMNAKVQEKLVLQDGLRRAIEHSEFLLLYQPQVDLGSGRITGVEALTALATSRAGRDFTGQVYSASRRNRFDRPYRRMGASNRVCAK